MLEVKSLQINGHAYTIAQLPASQALDVACIVADWRGRIFGAMGDDALHSQDAPIGVVSGAGRSISMMAKMLRDPEYRSKVWDVMLAQCSCDGVPVNRGDWETTFAGDRLGELYDAHNAAITHSCGGFLKGLGIGAAPAPQA